MRKEKRFFTLFMVVALVFSLLAGCSSKTKDPGSNSGNNAASGEKVAKDTLTLATFEDPTTMDPAKNNRVGIGLVTRQIIENLCKQEADGTYSPLLATSWEWKDKQTLRLNLRKDVKFSNGDEFTAEDVRFSFERAKADPISASSFVAFDIKNSVIVDKNTIDIKFSKPYAAALNILASVRGGIASKAAMEKMGDKEYARAPIGTGPYKFVKWDTASQIVLVRNDDYWGQKALTKNVVFKIITEAASRVIELETGGADIAYNIVGSDVERVNKIPGYKALVGQSYRYVFVTFSMKDELLSNKDLRYALSYAIDKEALVKANYKGTASVAKGMFSPNIFSYVELGAIPYDLNKAKELMAKAGYANGCEIELIVEPDEEFTKLAEVIQNMWAQIGVKTKVTAVNNATFNAQKGHWQAAIRAGNANEASNILIVYESAFGDRLQGNDAALDKQLLDARTIIDDKERAKVYGDIQKYLYDIRYSVPFAITSTIYGVSDKVEGFKFDPQNLVDLNTVKVYK